MQIRTPKKYQGVQRRSIISCRRLLFYLFMLLLIALGIGIFLNRQTLGPVVQDALIDAIGELEDRAATMAVPEPTATTDPGNKLTEANNYWTLGATSAAMDTYIEILGSVPNVPEVFRRVAFSMINLERIDEALEYAEQAVNADPYSTDAWAIRAWALDWAGRAGQALSSALHALELDPENSRAEAYLAEVYHSLGQTERAFSLTENTLERDPNSAEAYRARGLIKWLSYNDHEGAVEDFKTAYSIAENMDFVAVEIANIESIILGNHEEALEFLQEVIESNPRNTKALFLIGYIYRSQLFNPSQALRYLQDCVDFDPKNVNCQYELGRAQFDLEFYQDSADSLALAIESGSENPRHYYWAGETQRILDNCSRAMFYFDTGLQKAREQDVTDVIDALGVVIPLCHQTIAFPTSLPVDEETSS